MVRDRLLNRRWLIYLTTAWAVILAAAPHVTEAAPLPPRADGRSTGDLDGLRALLEQRIIRERLAGLGVSATEAAMVIERLSPAERAELAARVQELSPGGDGAVVFGVLLIVAALVILILELLGKRVISRP
ncbi:MAG: PA2779 family protein [Candidatus Rokubacteria bacterium]|nr:PA2779 family protein [Candidatus Rokubacteria bacterium]